jgi:hypothetical protein
VCGDHGAILPLWRPATAVYDAFAEHISRSTGFPTLGPWPLTPGWVVTDFGFVGDEGREPKAVFVTCAGPSEADGVVELTVVSEEAGVGLAARIAGGRRTDPGWGTGEGPTHVEVRIDGPPVALWGVSTSGADNDFDRSVFAGEAHGRWLWLVLRPPSAALLLNEEWVLHDLSDLGPELITLPFGGSPPAW